MKSTFTKIIATALLALLSTLSVEANYFHLASGGKLTSFESFDAAMEQASPRDTIFLTNPTSLYITITKPIVIIGNKSCQVHPAIDLKNEDIETAKVNIEGVTLDYDIHVKSNLGTLELKNCDYVWDHRSNTFNTRLDSKIGRAIIDRCIVHDVNLYFNQNINDGSGSNVNYKCNVENLIVRNSNINNSIIGRCADKENLMVVNSRIYDINANFYGDLRNCLIQNQRGEGEREYCYNFQNGGTYNVNGENKKVYFGSVEDLMALGFVGDDGTVAGPYGGDEPHYSLIPDVPTVDFKNSNVEYDKATKKLKIKVSVLKD